MSLLSTISDTQLPFSRLLLSLYTLYSFQGAIPDLSSVDFILYPVSAVTSTGFFTPFARVLQVIRLIDG